MRMFLVGMTDIFLILYLTSIANVHSTSSFLTVEDFDKLRAMHETLKSDKQKEEANLQERLRLSQEEKKSLAAKLAEEQARAKKVEKSLLVSDAKIEQIHLDLKIKETMLKQRGQLLIELNDKIKDKEAVWQSMEATYKKELEDQKTAVEANRMLAEKLKLEAQNAQTLADQMQKEADQALKAAEEARAVQQSAIVLKDAALKEKGEAEEKARMAHEARNKAEAEKEAAIKAAEEAKRIKAQAEDKAKKLAATIRTIKQDSDAAFKNNVIPMMQKLNVTYEEEVSNNTTVYKRELALLPVRINDRVFVFLPSQHIGFSRRYDTPPRGLRIMYKEQRIASGWIHKEDDLVAVELPGYSGKAYTPYPSDTRIDQLMPVLLSLRNKVDVSIGNFMRGLSNDYFAVNRDNISQGENGGMVYSVTGFRGTGMRAERIVRGDQLVDLNGRFIGIAKDADHIVQIDSLNGWEERAF